MPLNSSIIGGLDYGQSFNQQAAGSMSLAQGLQTMRNNNVAAQQQQTAAQRAAAEEAAIQQAGQKYVKPDGSLDQQGFLGEVARINPNKALEYQTKFDTHNKIASEAKALDDTHMKNYYELNKLEADMDDRKNSIMANFLQQAKTPEFYQSVVVPKARSLGYKEDEIPNDFSPDIEKNFVLGATAKKEKNAQELAQWEKGIKEKQLEIDDYKARHPAAIYTAGIKAEAAQEAARSANQDKIDYADSVIDAIERLEKNKGLGSAVGAKGVSSAFGLIPAPVGGSPAAGAVALHDALTSVLTLSNMGKIKGVLSDSDMKILRNASTSLTREMSEKDYRTELTRVKGVMNRAKEKAMQLDKEPSKSNKSTTENDPLGIL